MFLFKEQKETKAAQKAHQTSDKNFLDTAVFAYNCILFQSVQLKVNQVHNSTKLDSETTKEFYENIDKYIDQKLSEKNSQNDLVKEIEADKD